MGFMQWTALGATFTELLWKSPSHFARLPLAITNSRHAQVPTLL